jgi:hypothetical protein
MVIISEYSNLAHMEEAEERYIAVGVAVENSIQSQMFGKPCFKIGKKAFVCFFENEMVFKLNGESHTEALSLDGSRLFDPSGKGRSMKEWVQISFVYEERWQEFAHSAAVYVGLNQ